MYLDDNQLWQVYLLAHVRRQPADDLIGQLTTAEVEAVLCFGTLRGSPSPIGSTSTAPAPVT